jgi:hypothetical protein
VFLGKGTAPANSIGSNNTFVGFGSGSGVTSGTDNVFLGSNAGAVGNVTNAVAIGSNVKATTNNSILLGTANHTVSIPGATVFGETVDVNGVLTAKSTMNVTGTATMGGVKVPIAGVSMTNYGVEFSNGAIVKSGLIVSGGAQITGNAKVTGDIDATGDISAPTIGAGELTAGSKVMVMNQGSVITPNLNVTNTVKLSQYMASGGDGDFLCLDEDDFTVKYCFANVSAAAATELSGGLKTIGSIKAVGYQNEGVHRSGLVASDPATVDSAILKKDKKSVNPVLVIPALVGAIQEQQKQIEEQRQQIAILKAAMCSKDPANMVCGKSADGKGVNNDAKAN